MRPVKSPLVNPAFSIRLASQRDALAIAEMSRTLIEVGLGWSWTPKRVIRSVQDPETNVAVACRGEVIGGFVIARYLPDRVHIPLFAVERGVRRRGIGRALLRWVETTATTAGIGLIRLEARGTNHAARAFYRAAGYREIALEPRMYGGREAGVRLAKDLWRGRASPAGSA